MAKSKLKKDSFGSGSTNGLTYSTNILAKGKAGTLEVYATSGETTKKISLTSIDDKALAQWTAKELNEYIANLPDRDSGTMKGNAVEYKVVGDNGIKKSTITENEGLYPMGNRGGIAEGIYAAAIFLRFAAKAPDRADRILETTLKSFIEAEMTSSTGKLTRQAPNEGTTVTDDVTLQYGLKVKDHACLLDMRLWEHWKGHAVKIAGYKEIKRTGNNIIKAALDYVNNTNSKGGKKESVRDYAKTFYRNGVHNFITVEAEGEVAQDETKVDIRVMADNHDGVMVPDIMKISLKYGGVGQFGQMSGVSYEVTANVLKEFFGITKPAYSKASFESDTKWGTGSKSHKSDAAKAMFSMWEAEKDNLTKCLEENPDTFRQAYWRHISQGKKMVAEEPGVELVDAVGETSKIYNLDAIKDIDFSGLNLKAEWKVSVAQGKTAGGGMSHAPHNLCSTEITGKGGALGNTRIKLLAIRIKRGDSNNKGPYYRTIFEKQKGLGLLIKEAERTWNEKH